MFLLFFGFLSVQAASWTAPQSIPPNQNTITRSDVSYAYDTDNGLMYAAWPDDSGYPVYCVFNDLTGTWGNIGDISTSVSVNNTVQLSYITGKGQVMATWQTGISSPYFSIYDNGSWTPAAPINGANSLVDVYNVYNPSTGTIFAAWQDQYIPYYPIFSIYTYSESEGTEGSWSAPNQITNYSGVNSNVTLAYDSGLQTVIAAYGGNGSYLSPIYAIYEGNNQWTAGQIDPSTRAHFDVILAYDATKQRMYAAWIDRSQNNTPFVSYFSDSSKNWFPSFQLSSMRASSSDVSLTVAMDKEEVFASWVVEGFVSGSSEIYYSIYNGSEWTNSLLLYTTTVYDNAILNFDSGLSTVFAGWGNSLTNVGYVPTYSTYLVNNLGPVTLQGKQKVNSFGLVSELYNILTWQLRYTGELPLEGYYLYRNGVLIATLLPTQTKFVDHNRIPGQSYNYEVIPFNARYEGLPATIIVPN